MALTNWAGTYTYRARSVRRPQTTAEAQEIVRQAERIRVLGSRHSFSAISDSDELLSLDALPVRCEIDPESRTATVSASVRYGDLAQALDRHGLALANLASLPHISVAGAIQTATHGSGQTTGNLATSVAGVQLLRADGQIATLARGEPDFEGIVVGLGALGAILEVTLELQPAYEVRQWVFEHLEWSALFENFDAIMGSGYSVSAFTLWGEDLHQVWVKCRDGAEAPDALFGALPARENLHVIPGLDPHNCTEQLGVPGRWFARLPHFRMGFTPSSGAEIQSEFLVPRAAAIPSLEAVRGLSDLLRPLIQVSEIRSIARDGLWMSPQYATDTVGIHFTWVPRPAEVQDAVAQVEDALRPYGARPHWGKVFCAEAPEIGSMYARLGDFRDLRDRFDPLNRFVNPWFERRVGVTDA